MRYREHADYVIASLLHRKGGGLRRHAQRDPVCLARPPASSFSSAHLSLRTLSIAWATLLDHGKPDWMEPILKLPAPRRRARGNRHHSLTTSISQNIPMPSTNPSRNLRSEEPRGRRVWNFCATGIPGRLSPTDPSPSAPARRSAFFAPPLSRRSLTVVPSSPKYDN